MSRTLIVFMMAGAFFSGPFAGSRPAVAEELHEPFLEGLRDRGYYDYALYYLETLEKRTDLPNEIKQVIPYQRAVTLLEGASTINNPELRDQQLDRAVAQLEAFTRANPEHPLAANANTEMARILIEKARVKIWEADSPANAGNNEKFRLEGRTLLSKAREIFQKAHEQHKAAYEKFPKFIPQEERERYEARGKAETAYMRAQIDLALCTYEEAQTYPRGSQQFKNLLTKAAGEFANIHEQYRSMVGGLYSRMWQGKCFEEQNDIGKALGIYNELLAHPGQSQAMKNVQNQVMQFRLICLNHEARKDYQLVINEAGEWLSKNPKLAGYNVGLGIRFQKAIAHEKLAEKLKTDHDAAVNQAQRDMDKKVPLEPKAEIEGHLRKAILDAQDVTRYSGQYKAPSQFMISRIKGKLGLDEGDPKTIDEAIVKAEKMRQDIELLEAEVEAAQTKQEKTNREETLKAHLHETARIVNLALKLADEKTNVSQLTNLRFLLCYSYYKLERNYEAAVIGEFLAERYANSTEDSDGKLNEFAQNGAAVARAAWYQEYKTREEQQVNAGVEEVDLDFELDQLVRVCEMTTRLWPATGLADDSRMTLGRIYSKREQPVPAAKWFSEVTSDAQKGLAKASAGQAYWNAYLKGTDQPEDKRPKSEDLAAWQKDAKKYLEDGLNLMNGTIPEDASVEAATDLILARVTLAQINVYEQDYDAAVRYLTETKPLHHAPLASVKTDQDRPERGVKSQKFASLVYQVLLRAYVGKQQTNEALKTMDDLENVVGKENTADLSNAYRELGEQIGKEVKRLQTEGPKERLDAILASFNTFLNALFEPERRKSMSVGSLQWMAETFLNLGVGLKDATDPDSKAKAAEYFKKAEECYLAIIERAKQEAEPPKWLTGMKLRLANASRSAGNFEAALKGIEEVLREYPEAPNVQTAAAQLLQDWGTTGQTDARDRLKEAINGRHYEGQPDPKKPGIKGWMGLTNQYDLMLRPVRAQLRELRESEEKIIAYENTLKELTERTTRVDGAKTLGTDVQDAEADLAILTDAITATREWVRLKQERDKLQAELSAGTGDQEKSLDRIEQINRFLNHMVDSQHYESITSGALKADYEKQIAKLQEKSDKTSQQKIAEYESLLEEIPLEMGTPENEGPLPPAFRTGQRILQVRERLAVLLQSEYDQFAQSANINPGSSAMMEALEAQIDSIKPMSMDKKRTEAVRAELDALAKEGKAPTKEELQQQLKVLRNAINAWTAYELVQNDVNAPLAELTLDHETLRAKLDEKKTQLAQQITDAEVKEADLQERLIEVLHHVAETRHQLAKVQSSNVEKEKDLRAAVRDVTALTSRVPREDISGEWWGKFNGTYKDILRDLKPFAKDGETIDPAQDIPVPERVVANLTWLERPSNTSVVVRGPGDGRDDETSAAPPESLNMTWVILGLLLALGGTGAVVYFMMGAQKKKPFRVNYGSGPLGGEDKFVFPGEGLDESAPKRSTQPRPVKKAPAPAGQSSRPRSPGATSGDAPRKAAPKRRPPEAAGEPPKPRPKPRPPE